MNTQAVIRLLEPEQDMYLGTDMKHLDSYTA